MGAFSEFYDRLVGADYDQISEFIAQKIKQYKPDSELLCDLGCGTGSITALVAKHGYDMIAIDLDAQMLSQAKDRFDRENLPEILLLNQDISEFELYGTVDVIFSTLDTVNYLMSKKEIDKLFKLVRNYLNYNGLFIFDVNTEYKFRNILGDNVFTFDDENIFCSWQSYYDKKSEKCYHELTYFEKKADGSYTRYNDSQQQRYYSCEYLNSLFERYGFEILETDDNYSQSKITKTSQRKTFVLKINK